MTKNKIQITMDFLSTKLFRTNEEGEFRMKFKNIVMMVLMAVLGLPSLYAQETKTAPAAANNSGGGGAAIEPLERVTLEDFEESEDWRAKSTTPLGQTKVLKMIQRGIIKDVFDEKSVPDKKDDKGQYVPVAEDQKDRIGANHILGVKTFFAEKGFDPSLGARPLKRIIQKLILDPMAFKIVIGEIKDGDKIQIEAENKEIVLKLFSKKSSLVKSKK